MNTAQLDAVTRRLQGRELATIDDIVGVSGQAPAIVITWSDRRGKSKFYYDSMRDRSYALDEARDFASSGYQTYDVIDNTL